MVQEYTFGHWLRRKRKALDLTQEALAAKIACSKAAVRKFESGERIPSVQIIDRLIQIFDIPEPEWVAFRRFARGRSEVAPGADFTEATWQFAPKTHRSNLPAAITPLVDRQQELAQIGQYLLSEAIRLVNLVGPPGIGKTRLSLEAARDAVDHFSGGVFFIELAALEDPALIIPTILQTLGFVDKIDLPAREQLIKGIGNQHMLLVLDNCEHIVDAAAVVVSDLITACPKLKILTTSRESFHIPGEWLYSVQPLEFPIGPSSLEPASQSPALALFTERARSVRPDFAINSDNLSSVLAICEQLDGLPLAIELVAARLRLMSPQMLLERLSDQWMLALDGRRAVSPRQRNLINAIDWSYQLLTQDEQKMFTWLAVFANGFTLRAVERCFSSVFSNNSVTNLIEALLDKSLIQLVDCGDSETRFSMLFVIHQFALNHLIESGDEAEARNSHLAYFLAFVEEAEKAIHGPDQIQWIDLIEREHANILAALEWCMTINQKEIAFRLLAGLGWPWEVRSYYYDARTWLDRIRTLPGDGEMSDSYARLLNHIGRHAWTQGNLADAKAFLKESQIIAEKLGLKGEIALAEALNWSGLVAHYVEKDDFAAKTLVQRALALYQKRADPWGIALSTFHLGLAEREHDSARALALLEQSLAYFRRTGDLFFISRVSGNLGLLFLQQGNIECGRWYMLQQLQIDQELQFWDGISSVLRDLENLSRDLDEMDQAEQYHAQRLKICREHGLFFE
jgi:predicted ATPase/DNA-binding XRE family transcriptional regulator